MLVGGQIREELIHADMPGICKGCRDETWMEEKKLFEKDGEAIEECIQGHVWRRKFPLEKRIYTSGMDYSLDY
jgi:hypothetical protein